MGPHRLDYLLENRHRHATARRAAAQSAALSARIVVAEPDRHRDVIGEAHEPSVVLIVRGTGLARDVGGKSGDRARCAARQNALHHSLELIEGGAIDGIDCNERSLVTKDGFAIALDRFDDVGRWTLPFVCDGRIEGRKIDGPHRLGTEHERIVALAFAIYMYAS